MCWFQVDGVARIKIDGSKGTYKLSPGEHIFTSGSVTLEVLNGTAEIEFLIEGSIIFVHVEGTVVCKETIFEGELQALNLNVVDGYVTVDGETLLPGETFTIMSVDIDIKPGSDPNCFNLNGHGVIPVAVLGSAALNVGDIKTDDTLSFNGLAVRVRGNKGPLCSIEDSDGDEFLDLVCHFEDDPSEWIEGTEDNAILEGELVNGTQIEGTDSICIVP